jgi:hypothetical protein
VTWRAWPVPCLAVVAILAGSWLLWHSLLAVDPLPPYGPPPVWMRCSVGPVVMTHEVQSRGRTTARDGTGVGGAGRVAAVRAADVHWWAGDDPRMEYRDLRACFAAGHNVCSYIDGGPLHYRSLALNDGGAQSQSDPLPDNAHPDREAVAEADPRGGAVRDDGALRGGV